SAACFDESGRNGTSDHFPTVPVKELGIGYGAICGIDTNDALFCEATTVALDLEPPDDDWLKVSVGTQFACGIRVDDGSIDCFGSENFGTCTYSPPAGQLDPPDGSFTDIATGTNTSCAIRTDGSVACWGGVELDEEAGECELVHDEGQLEAPDGSFLGISVATSHACGIRQDHGVACWGAGTTDDCETGSVSCRQARPPSGRFEQVVTGTVHSCAMTVDRKVTCWGHDGGGRTTPPAEFQ
ncbi:MAG TPA: hypothetical protein VGL98_10055, partial [Gammaproteobacteria bacterium]